MIIVKLVHDSFDESEDTKNEVLFSLGTSTHELLSSTETKGHPRKMYKHGGFLGMRL